MQMNGSFYKCCRKNKSNINHSLSVGLSLTCTTIPVEMNLVQAQSEKGIATAPSNFLFRMSRGLTEFLPNIEQLSVHG